MGADWYGLDMIQQFTPHLAGKWGVMPLPIWKDDPNQRNTSCFAGQGLLIPAKSQRVDDAWKFIHFVITDREANVKRFVQGNSFPAYRPSWADRRMHANSEYFGNQAFGKLLMELADQVPSVAMNAKRPQAVFIMRENLFAAVMQGALTPAQALANLKKALER